MEGFDATTGFLSAVSKASGGEDTTPLKTSGGSSPLKTPSKSLAGVGTPLKRKAAEPGEEVSKDTKKISVAASPKEMPASSKGASSEVMSTPSIAAASSKEMAPASGSGVKTKDKKDKKEKKTKEAKKKAKV